MKLRTYCFSILFILCSANVFAQNVIGWKELTNKSTAHFNKAEFDQALDAGFAAYELANAAKVDHLRIKSLNQIAWDFQAQGQLDEAEKHLNFAISIESKMTPINRWNLSREFVMLARLHMLQKKFESAQEILTKVIESLENSVYKKTTDASAPLAMLGEIAIEKGDFDKALSYLERAYRLYIKPEQLQGRYAKELLKNLSVVLNHIGNQERLKDIERRLSEVRDDVSSYSLEKGRIHLETCLPEYPREAFQYRLQGVTRFESQLDIDGMPIQSTILKGSGWKILDDMTIKTTMQCRHLPSVIGGNPIIDSTMMDLVWTMDDRDTDPQYVIVPDTCGFGREFVQNNDLKSSSDIQLRFLINGEGAPVQIKMETGTTNAEANQRAIDALKLCRLKAGREKFAKSFGASFVRLNWVVN